MAQPRANMKPMKASSEVGWAGLDPKTFRQSL